MTRRASLHRRLGLLAVGFISHLQGAEASPFSQQLFIGGSDGPYGYSAADFRQAILRPLTGDAEIAPDIEIKSSDGPISGWKLGVHAFDNVPIPAGNPDSNGGTKVFDTATIHLSPRDSAQRDELRDWSLCSAVWTMGLSEAALAAAKASDTGNSVGSCGGMLPDDCIAEMVAGFNSAGFCQNQTMPRSCAPFLANGTDGVTRGSNLPQSGIAEFLATGLASPNVNDVNTTFYAAATGPLDKDDAAAFEAVKTWVFPVVLSWTRREGSSADSFVGTPEGDTGTYVACVRAAVPGSGKHSGDGIGSDASRASGTAWLLVGALAAVWAAVL
ncbi:hypothetical protein B0T16DRAFT_459133 [Cercophora newfieldiana]|uniref:Uncharacterized protein n=1 Tax=Cercophora newfieldiana TaxID=92897 RepID=A0AA39XZ17_9PEZI|nr:hypothetical protein B0T16DRAFT_459133 [Cercophora newfieldiana]